MGGVITTQAETPPLPSAAPGRVAKSRLAAAVAAQAPASTGGTAEPNDQPYGDVFFKTYGTNPFIDTEDDRLSTFGLDVDTGSWGVARRYLARRASSARRGDPGRGDPQFVPLRRPRPGARRLRDLQRRRSLAVPARRPLSRSAVRHPRSRSQRGEPQAGHAHLHGRRVGLDGAGGPAGARQERAPSSSSGSSTSGTASAWSSMDRTVRSSSSPPEITTRSGARSTGSRRAARPMPRKGSSSPIGSRTVTTAAARSTG